MILLNQIGAMEWIPSTFRWCSFKSLERTAKFGARCKSNFSNGSFVGVFSHLLRMVHRQRKLLAMVIHALLMTSQSHTILRLGGFHVFALDSFCSDSIHGLEEGEQLRFPLLEPSRWRRCLHCRTSASNQHAGWKVLRTWWACDWDMQRAQYDSRPRVRGAHALVDGGGFLRSGLGLTNDQWIHLNTLERANMVAHHTMGTPNYMASGW